jgi:hypothetical protein
MTISRDDMEARAPMMRQALAARDRLASLSRSESWRTKYLGGDPEAVAQYDALVAQHATGVSFARDIVYGEAAAVDAGGYVAHLGAVHALTHDPDFVQRYLAGDAAAKAQWDQVSTEGAAAVTGAGPDNAISQGDAE